MVEQVSRHSASSMIEDLDSHKHPLSSSSHGHIHPGSSFMVTTAEDGEVRGVDYSNSSSSNRSQALPPPPSSSSTGVPFQRTSTRESHQSAGSGEILSSSSTSNTSNSNTKLSGIISNTKALFNRHQKKRGSSISSPTSPDSTTPSSLSLAQSDSSTNRRSPAPTSIELPPPPGIGTLDSRFSPSAASFVSNDTRSSSGGVTSWDSCSSSVPQASTCATSTASDLSRSTSHELQHNSPVEGVGSEDKAGHTSSRISSGHNSATTAAAITSTSASASAGPVTASTSPRMVDTLPPGAALLPMTTEARYKALPRLESYSVTHPEASLDRIDSRDSEGTSPDTVDEERDSTTSLSGTETELEESELEEEEQEEEEEEDDEHDEQDVRGGVNAMRSALSRPALPTLSSTRGFSRTANTPGVSPTAATSSSSNPFSFSGWTTFASTTPTPGPLRTARPQAGDNTVNGSYFDPRPTSSSSRASTIFQTPSQTPRTEGTSTTTTTSSGNNSTGKATRPLSQIINIPTPSSSISPPASRQRVESRPTTANSPLNNRRQSSSLPPIIKNAEGQPVPASAIPLLPTSGGSSTVVSPSTATTTNQNAQSSVPSSTFSTTPRQVAQSPSDRPAFYARQSKSLVDLSRSLDKQTSITSVNTVGDGTDTASDPIDEVQLTSGMGGNDGQLPSSPPPAIDATAASAHPEQIASATGVNIPDAAHAAEIRARAQTLAFPNTSTSVLSNTGRSESPARPVQRRQSMPEMRFDPPGYQIDDDFNIKYVEGRLPTAREDEGREALPGYSCEVHIEGYVPRKMEFVKPGVQSKDRRWKRQYVILHGTSVKVYKSDPRQKAVPGEEPPPTPGIYSEKQRPSFSSTSSRQSAGSNKQFNATGSSSARLRAPTASSISSVSSTQSEKSMLYNQAVQDALSKKKYDPDMPVHVHPQEEDEHGLASLQHAPSTLLAKASENRCIRHYTLQGAESGLAADYLKRRHVVRIRAEGEQFLIQCKDDRAVIDWIEALQAATNTALDLDVRPLPKFITLPRRRRRRRVDPNAPATTTGTTATTTTASGTAATGDSTTTTTAGASAAGGSSTPPNQTGGAGQISARSDAMNAMLAEDQDNYLSTRNAGLV